MFKGILGRLISRMLSESFYPEVPIHVLPGGAEPERGRRNDAAIDVMVRAIVFETFIRENTNHLRRKMVWNFDSHLPVDGGSGIMDPGRAIEDENIHKFVYVLNPGEAVPVGLGVAVDIPSGFAGFVVPRGSTVRSLVYQSRIDIGNSHVPIDPEFTSEIWAEVVNYGPKPIEIFKGMRLCQLIVVPAVTNFKILREGNSKFPANRCWNCRGANAHGSTGQ